METRPMLTKAALGLVLGLIVFLGWGAAGHSRTSASPPAAAPPAVLGTISGRVTRNGGQPAAGVTVCAIPAGFPRLRLAQDNPNTAVTDAGGWYTMVVRPVRFTFYSGPIVPHANGFLVFVRDPDQSYLPPPDRVADPAAVPAHVVTGVDFVLRLGPEVAVRVRDAITGAPVPGLTIRYGSKVGIDHTAGETGPDGALRFRVPYTDIRLEADVPDARRGLIEAAPGNSFYREITAMPGKEVVWEIKTYGATRQSDWHGRVLAPDGTPVAGATVQILRASYQGSATVTTDAQGRFSARMPRLDGGELGSPYYPRPVVCARRGVATAAQIVTPDESWDGLTLRLAPGAALAGRVMDAQGHAAARVAVSLSGAILGISEMPFPTPHTVTDDRGRFTLDGLPPGEYQVQIHGGGFGDLALPPAVSDPHIRQSRLTLAAGERIDIGPLTPPRADRALAGTVVDERGGPVPGLFVRVTGAHTHQDAATQADGTFRVYDLVAEPLTVAVGVPGHEVTATIKPGEDQVRLTAPPDVVATNGQSAPPTPPSPPAQPPSGPPAFAPDRSQAPLNGLALVILPGAGPDAGLGGALTAEILRPNAVNPAWFAPLPPDTPSVWRGTMADLDGMRLTVRDDRGTLADRAGRVLWSGVVRDPPDYVVTCDRQRALSTVTITDGRGKRLWSGPTAHDGGVTADGGNIRVIGLGHTVAWERAMGDARVELRNLGSAPSTDPRPLDGTITLRVVPATATLRAVDGHLLLSASAPIVTATLTGFPPPPGPPPVDARMSAAYATWYSRRWLLCPPPMIPFLGVQNAPHGATLAYTDAATGRPIPDSLGTFR